MAAPSGLRTVQKFPKTLGRAFVEEKAEAATEDGATSTDITDDGTSYILTVDWPPLEDGQDQPAATATATAAPPVPAPPPGAAAAAAAPNHALAFAEAIVQHWESCSLTVYHGKADRPDVWTIGWGCTRIDGKPVNPNTPPITQQRADQLLANDLSVAQVATKRQIVMPLTEFQEAALISFTYNLGEPNLQASTLRTLLNEGHVDAAAAEFGKWVMSSGQRVKGLIRRRGAEQAVFEGKVPFGPQLPVMLDQFGDAALATNPV
jgi:lysozyme